MFYDKLLIEIQKGIKSLTIEFGPEANALSLMIRLYILNFIINSNFLAIISNTNFLINFSFITIILTAINSIYLFIKQEI